MLGTIFHYAVVAPKDDHAECNAQRLGIIAYHERNGYRQGGAYNGHFCWHGEAWLSYEGPNQASGDPWANVNLEAWCYLATVDTPVTDAAAQCAYDLTLRNPRDRIHPHSDFYQTSCCGDPLRAWIAAGALPPNAAPTPEDCMQPDLYVDAESRVWVYDGNNHTKTWVNGPDTLSAIQTHRSLNGLYTDPVRNGTTDRLLAGAVEIKAASSGGGTGPTVSEIRQGLRAELDKTKLAPT